MEKSLKCAMRLSSIFRGWTKLSNATASSQHVCYMLKNYTTGLKDINKYKAPPASSNNDVDLSFYKKPDEILNSISIKNVHISGTTAVNALKAIWKHHKETGSKSVEDILHHKGFYTLCEAIRRDVRKLSPYSTIVTLRILIRLRVLNDSALMQTLLQIIRVGINDLSLKDSLLLYYGLNGCNNRTHLAEAIYKALPIVIHNKIQTEIDPCNARSLIRLLHYLSKVYSVDDTQKVIGYLEDHLDNLQDSSCLSIFYGLSTAAALPESYTKLLSAVMQKLIESEASFPLGQIPKLLSQMYAKEKQGYKGFYSEILVDKLINYAISADVSLRYGTYLLSLLNNLKHVNLPLLDYLAGQLFIDQSTLADDTVNLIPPLINGFFLADYKPVFWDTVRDKIMNSNVGATLDEAYTCKLAVALVALDCYCPEMISRIFRNDKQPHLEYIYPLNRLYNLYLYQGVKIMYPQYSGPWPNLDGLIEDYDNTKPFVVDPTFKAALEQAFGGPRYILSNVKSKLGHFINHVVVLRKGGYPIAINMEPDTHTCYIEDLQYPENSNVILVFYFTQHAYPRNSRRLMGLWSFMLRCLETLTGFSTLAVNSTVWNELSDHEKIPYVMQAVKLKCDDFCTV